MNTWLIVALAVLVIFSGILWLRLHAFLTLLCAAFLVACMSSGEPLAEYLRGEVAQGRLAQEAADALAGQTPIRRLSEAFGKTVGSIGILIALASIIGTVLSASGAAKRIVTTAVNAVGVNGTPAALAVGSFVLGIPVFFDTVFYLMIPLARSAYQTIGKDYVLLVLSILAGGSLAHSLVPPTPGPLLIADILDIDLSVMMAVGMSVAFFGGGFSLLAAKWINRLVSITPKFDVDFEGATAPNDDSENESPMPALALSVLPIVIPVILIVSGAAIPEATPKALATFLETLCDKNVALAIGVLSCVPLLVSIPTQRRKRLVAESLESAGGIILITAAGGALGKVLAQAGVARAVSDLTVDVGGLWVLVLAFGITVAVRTLQGSATVAMITSAGILQDLAVVELPFHPVYLAMAIGAGSKPVSWMTDSAFWVITQMSGMSEKDGLRTITPMSIAMGISALVITMIAAVVIPFPV